MTAAVTAGEIEVAGIVADQVLLTSKRNVAQSDSADVTVDAAVVEQRQPSYNNSDTSLPASPPFPSLGVRCGDAPGPFADIVASDPHPAVLPPVPAFPFSAVADVDICDEHILTVGTDFSGLETPSMSLSALGIGHRLVFASDSASHLNFHRGTFRAGAYL